MSRFIFCLLCYAVGTFPAFSQTIYDTASSFPVEEQTELLYCFGTGCSPKTLTDAAARDEFRSSHCTTNPDNPVNGSFRRRQTSFEAVYNTSNGRLSRLSCTYSRERYTSTDGVFTWEHDGSSSSESRLSGESITNNTCANYPTHGHKRGDSCFDVSELDLIDSCNQPNVVPADGSDPDNICYEKPDGSKCRMSKVTSNGQTSYAQVLEPESCYIQPPDEPELPDYIPPSVAPPSGAGCEDIGNGVVACPELPENVCDANGDCQSGCGSFSFDGGDEQFICFSNDTDGDGTGDYKDDDIDGDGINNDDDTDDDGDGVPDEDDPDHDPDNDGGSGGGSDSLVADLLQSSNSIQNNIARGIGELNSSIDEITDVSFSTDGAGRDTSFIDGMFSVEDIEELKTQAATKSTELQARIEEIKVELSTLFDVESNVSSFESRTLTIGGNTYDISFARFSGSFSIIGSIVLFLSILAVAAIILGGRR